MNPPVTGSRGAWSAFSYASSPTRADPPSPGSPPPSGSSSRTGLSTLFSTSPSPTRGMRFRSASFGWASWRSLPIRQTAASPFLSSTDSPGSSATSSTGRRVGSCCNMSWGSSGRSVQQGGCECIAAADASLTSAFPLLSRYQRLPLARGAGQGPCLRSHVPSRSAPGGGASAAGRGVVNSLWWTLARGSYHSVLATTRGRPECHREATPS